MPAHDVWGAGLSLTGVPLLVACWLGTKLALGLTIIGWRRGGRARLLTRTVSVLVLQAVGLFSFGVVANRAFDLYPSWNALLHPVPKPKAVTAPAARLDGWLHSKDVRSAGHGVTFTWDPPGWNTMGLAQAPTVFVPQAYFDGPLLRFPVVVVVAPPRTGPSEGAWDDKQVLETMAGYAGAIVVFLRATHASLAGPWGVESAVADRLPYALSIDLRVETHRWAIAAVGTDADVALTALAQRPERYQEAALIADGAAPLPPAILAQVRRRLQQQSLCLVAAVRQPAFPQSDRLLLVPAAPQRLTAALRWLYALLPAPLNPPETGPIGIPPKPQPKRPYPRGTPIPGMTGFPRTGAKPPLISTAKKKL